MKSSSTSPVAMHKKFRPAGAPRKKMKLGQTEDQQILQTVAGNYNEKTIRTRFVQMVLEEQGVVGACFLSRDAGDLWAPAMKFPSSGRLPERTEFDEEFSRECDTIVQSNAVRTRPFKELTDFTGVFAPVRPRGGGSEILMVLAQKNAIAVIAKLQKIASAMQLWINAKNSGDADWQVLALGSIIELVGKVESQPTRLKAAEEVANLLANRVGCDSVAVGLVERGRMKLKAISGVSKIDHGSKSSQDFLQAMVESRTRLQPGIYPAAKQENNFLLKAHKQLASGTNSESVRSQPLIDEDENLIGSIVMTGPAALLQASQVERFTATAAPAIASSVAIVGKLRQGVVARTSRFVSRKISVAKRIAIVAAIVGFVLLMFLPVTYRVRCNCVTEPVMRRFAVAPFDGQIVSGRVEAGDFVRAGDVLAEMDGREIRSQLSGVFAEREQSLRTREMELHEGHVPETMLAELEFDRLVSEEDVLEYKRDNLLIKSRVDGVVLSGSLERAEAASVTTGQTLFEIGPVKPLRIEIAIPSEEIAQVESGFTAKVWIEGQEDRPIEGTIGRIHPRSETRDARNVFIAEIEFPNDDERLRPGMKGSVRIDCNERSLGWSLFHKPVNYIRSRLIWW